MNRHTPPQRIAGFTLVEVLIAMVIALIGIVLMTRVIENAERQKRSTAAGGDAQVAGAIALYNLERDIRQAGNGFGGLPTGQMGCIANVSDDMRSTPAIANFTIVPVQITDGVNGAADTVTVVYGRAQTDALAQLYSASTAASKQVDPRSSHAGFVSGDLVLVVSGASCGLIEITGHSTSNLQHGIANYNAHYPGKEVAQVADASYEYAEGGVPLLSVRTVLPRYNSAGFNPGSSGTLYNLGLRSDVRRNVWSIVNDRALNLLDTLHDDGAVGPGINIGEGIVNLQAEYGLDTNATRDYIVDTWQSAAPADWTRVIAIRVALLARSQQYEAAALPIYASCATTIATDPANCQRPSWTGGGFVMRNIDGTADTIPGTDNDWRRYRYRVYQATIPLRNVIWGTAP